MTLFLTRHFTHPQNNKGFTLLELIAVILILSLTTVAGTGIVISLIKGQALVKKQSQVLINSQLSMDRMAKQLRLALPFSLVETNANRCLRFLPVVASGFYRDELPDNSNALPPAGRTIPINVSPYNIVDGAAVFLSVGAESVTEIYGGSASSLAPIRSGTATTLTLNQNHRWQQNSLEQRFFITDNAQAFCVVNNELRYYSDVSRLSPGINLNGDYHVLMNFVSASGRIFDVEDEVSGCQHCVDIQLQFAAQDIEQTKNIKVSLYYAR